MSEKTYWNGEECTARKVFIIMRDESDKFPCFWGKELAGKKVKAIEVSYFPDEKFYLFDEDDQGWLKVTKGQGSPQYGHRSISPADNTKVEDRD